MKALVILGILVLAFGEVRGQTLAEDAKGKSSIAFGGSSINLDIAEASLSANFSNFRNLSIGKPKMPIWGVSAYGSNSDGLATLFSGGKFQPSTRLGGFLGIRKTLPKSLRDASIKLDKALNNQDYRELTRLKELYIDTADATINSLGLSNNDKIDLKRAVRRAIGENRKPDTPAAVTARINALPGDPAAISAVLGAISAIDAANNTLAAGGLNARLIASNATIPPLRAAINAARASNPNKILTLYVAGGFNASSFRFYDQTVTGAINNRFTRTPYRGGYADIGVNYSTGAHWLLGISAGYERANTFDQLTLAEFTVRTTENLDNQQIISERKFSGYTGAFKLYNQGNIRTDAIYFSQLGGEDSDYRLAWNTIYVRGFLSDDNSAAQSQLAIGTGLNFFKIKDGSFLGGFYIQADDVTNAQSATDNIFGRISFGIVAKYAFRTILSGF